MEILLFLFSSWSCALLGWFSVWRCVGTPCSCRWGEHVWGDETEWRTEYFCVRGNDLTEVGEGEGERQAGWEGEREVGVISAIFLRIFLFSCVFIAFYQFTSYVTSFFHSLTSSLHFLERLTRKQRGKYVWVCYFCHFLPCFFSPRPVMAYCQFNSHISSFFPFAHLVTSLPEMACKETEEAVCEF